MCYIKGFIICLSCLLMAYLPSAEETNIDIVPVIDPNGYLVYCPCMGMPHLTKSINNI